MIFKSGSMLRIDSPIISADGKYLSVRGLAIFPCSGRLNQSLVSGTVSVLAANISGSKLFAPLLTRLAPLGFREPVDLKLSFRLDAGSLRLISFQLVSGSHAVRLTGSLLFPGELVDFAGNVDDGILHVRGFGTIQDPIWQLISPARR